MDKLRQAKETYGLPISRQTIGKFSLNQIPMQTLIKFTTFFIILIWPSIRQQSLRYEFLEGLLYILGAL